MRSKSLPLASIALVAVLLATGVSRAQSAVDDYFAADDRARETLKQANEVKYPYGHRTKEQEAEFDALAQRLSRELEPMMRRLVGPVPKGFPGEGEYNHQWGFIGWDRLDGMRYSLGGRTVLLTTDEILLKWLEKRLPDSPELRADLDADFRSDRLAAGMVDNPGEYSAFSMLSVDRPASLTAVSVSTGKYGMSDMGAWPPALISYYLRKDHRIILSLTGLEMEFAPIPACDALLAEDKEKSRHRDPPFDVFARFNKCWEEQGKSQPGFAAATKQAQAFVNDLARRAAE